MARDHGYCWSVTEPPTSSCQSRALFIAGTHCSGTSLMGGLVRHLGVDLSLPPIHPTSPAATPVASVLSVFMATDDDTNLLLDALASVERATRENVEVNVVNEGRIGLECQRILTALDVAGCQFLRPSNRGLAAARDTGIVAAAGSDILLLEADNHLLPGFVEAAMAILEANPTVGIVHSGWRCFDQRSGTVDGIPVQIRKMADGNAIDACAVFRRPVWKAPGGYHEAISGLEDWEFWLHALSFGWGSQLISGPGFDDRVRPESLIHRSNRIRTRHHLRRLILQRHTALPTTQRPRPLHRCAIACCSLLPARLAGCHERQFTWRLWHIAWGIVHRRGLDASARKAATKG